MVENYIGEEVTKGHSNCFYDKTYYISLVWYMKKESWAVHHH